MVAPDQLLEQAEFFLGKHLWEIHGKRLIYRVETETGRRIDVPGSEEPQT